MWRNRFLKFFIVLSLFYLSCSKSTGEKDRQAPVVIIQHPVHNAIIAGDQVMNISGTVTDNEYIDEIHIEISDLQTGEEYLHIHIHPNGSAYTYNQPFNPASGINYLVRVIAEDPSDNISSQKVEFSAR